MPVCFAHHPGKGLPADKISPNGFHARRVHSLGRLYHRRKAQNDAERRGKKTLEGRERKSLDSRSCQDNAGHDKKKHRESKKPVSARDENQLAY